MLVIVPDLNVTYLVLQLLISFREVPWYILKFTTCEIFAKLGGGEGCCTDYGASRSETAPSSDLVGSDKY